MTEAELQQRITDLCDWMKLTWHHETDSRRSKAGFPDLVIVGPGGVLFAELKTEKGRVSPEQQVWLSALELAGAEVYVWRPSHWPFIMRRLSEISHLGKASQPK